MFKRVWGIVALVAVVVAGLVVGLIVVGVKRWVGGASGDARAAEVGKFTVSKETTGIVSPLRGDGRPDYVAAINERYSKGVRPEENAFTGWIEMGGTWSKGVPPVAVREEMARMCGAKGQGGPAFVSYSDLLTERKITRDMAVIYAIGEARKRMWREEEYPLVAEMVKTDEGFLDAMAGVWKRPGYWVPAVSDGSGALFMVSTPSIMRLREAGDALLCRAMLRMGRGDFEGFFADVETVQRMARHVARGRSVIETMEGYVMDVRVSEAIGAAAGSGVLTKAQCERLVKLMDDAGALETVAEKVDCSQRWSELDFELLVARREVPTLEEGSGDKEYEKEWAMYETVEAGAVDWDRMMRETNAVFDEQIAALKAPTMAEVRSGEEKVLARYGANEKHDFEDLGRQAGEQAEAYQARVTKRIVGDLLGDFWRAELRERVTRMEEGMARAVVASAMYRAEKGKWPEGLGELVPGYLAAVPVDMNSKNEQELVRYATGEGGVRVYSVGANGVDDGGLENKDDVVVGVVVRRE